MADLKISSFVSSKVQEFLKKFDTDKSGVIEESKGELANLLSGIKNGELANIDSLSLHNVSATRADSQPSPVDFDATVKSFNKADINTRRTIAHNTALRSQEEIENMNTKIEVALLNALNPKTFDINMYKHNTGVSLETALEQQIKDIVENYVVQYDNTRKKVQSAIKSYDSRYATDYNTLGVSYFRTKDTEVITGSTLFSELSNLDAPTPEKWAQMDEKTRDSHLRIFESAVYIAYNEALTKLYTASYNIDQEIQTNYETTMKSVKEVAENGNLTHTVEWVSDLTGPHYADKFNINEADPATYNNFIRAVVQNYSATDISEAKKDESAPDGKFIKDGKMYIRKKGVVYDLQGNKVK